VTQGHTYNTVRARAAVLAYAEEPRSAAAAGTGGDRGGDAGEAASGAGDRVFSGHVPGRSADTRAERGGHVRVPPSVAHAISSAWETVVVRGETDVERARHGCGFICVRGTCLGLRCGC